MGEVGTITFQQWVKTLPYSRVARPNALRDRFKYHFWRLYTPYHPVVRDSLLAARIVKHAGRQRYLLGTLARGKSIAGFVEHLIAHGYGNHFVAWKDEGEVVGLRRVLGFTHQYHIRIFEDGEVRGHFEYTPESYPLLHFWAIGMEDRRAEFEKLLRGWVV